MLLSQLNPGDRLELSKTLRKGGIRRKIVTVISSCNRYITVDHGNYTGTVNLAEIKTGQIKVKFIPNKRRRSAV